MALQIKKILNRLMRKCKKRVRHGRVKKIPYSDSESDYIRIDLYIGQLMRKDMLMVMKEREARCGEECQVIIGPWRRIRNGNRVQNRLRYNITTRCDSDMIPH